MLFFVSEDWFFLSHFLYRAKAAQASGYAVAVVCTCNGYEQRILDAGLTLLPVALNRRGANPIAELSVLLQLWRHYRSFAPDLVHHVAIKPVFYGSLMARLCGIRKVINAPVGMGFVVSSQSLKARLLIPVLKVLYRIGLKHPGTLTILENPGDIDLLSSWGAMRRSDARLIRGAGVDLEKFAQVQADAASVTPVVLLAARLLREKGIGEYVQAARILHAKECKVEFLLAGDVDAGNPGSFSEEEIQRLCDDGAVRWLKFVADIPALLRQVHIACLPSYREGCSKFIQEAAASGLAIVTSDAPGCGDLIVDGETGRVVPAGDARALADAIEELCMDTAQRSRLAEAAQLLAHASFGEAHIAQQTLAVYEEAFTHAN